MPGKTGASMASCRPMGTEMDEMHHDLVTCIALPGNPNHVCPNCGQGWICVDSGCESGPILPCPGCLESEMSRRVVVTQ
jgi:hypothetical protein